MPNFQLKNGYYVVTGGLGLLGKKHCEAISKYGGTPLIIDINKNEFKEFAEYILKTYEKKMIFFDIDITKESSLEKIIEECKSLPLPIRGLVNNAARNPIVKKKGLDNQNRLENFCLEEWNKDLNVGLTGAFLCTKYFGSIMNEGFGGVIVNISSDLGLIAPNQELYKDKKLSESSQPVKPVSYSVVKSGLIGLTRYTATYWPKKVRCNCLCAGGVKNDQNPEFISKVNDLIPMGRLAEQEEYMAPIIFMLSEASSYMNGSIISIDGGRTAW